MGGRISTRQTPRGVYNHGAPELHVTDASFGQFLNSLDCISRQGGSASGAPYMRAPLDKLADGLSVHQNVEVTEIKNDGAGWRLQTASGRLLGCFQALIVTMPAPQAAKLVRPKHPDLSKEIDAVQMLPVWTCMVEFSEALELADHLGAKDQIMRANRMNSKPQSEDAREAWVVHMTPEFTKNHLFAEPAVMAPIMLEAFCDAFGVQTRDVLYLNAHRWRYAFVDQPLGRPFVGDTQSRLWVGGDWTLGNRAEHGFLSGRAMAEAVLSSEVVTV